MKKILTLTILLVTTSFINAQTNTLKIGLLADTIKVDSNLTRYLDTAFGIINLIHTLRSN